MRVAVYLEVADGLARRLAGRAPGTRVPSEHEVAAAHGVSRLTARAALQELERRHLVDRERGRGTFVARRVEHRVATDAPPSLAASVAGTGCRLTYRLFEVRSRRPSHEVRDALGLGPGGAADGGAGERVLVVRRVALLDDEPVTYTVSHLVERLVPGLAAVLTRRARAAGRDDPAAPGSTPSGAPSGSSLYATLRDLLGAGPVRRWSRAELDVAPADVAARLGVDGRPFLWRMTSCNDAGHGGPPLELSRSWLRADRLRVVFELGPQPAPDAVPQPVGPAGTVAS